MNRRCSGILLHITSLPSDFGIGDFGPEAYAFADFLAMSGQKIWQILPLNPTNTAHGNSPYHANSAFALNPILISPQFLLNDGWLDPRDMERRFRFLPHRVNYRDVTIFKNNLLEKAFSRLKQRDDRGFSAFCLENAHWLKDFSLFTVLKDYFRGAPWFEWPVEFRDRDLRAIHDMEQRLHDETKFVSFIQFLLFRQWSSLREYCNRQDIKLFGDIPIYMVHDSADVWANPEIFNLDEDRRPITVAGVPPDYFSETGQLWGNPVYRWDVLKEQGFDWWIRRIRHNLSLYDMLRIDHFRGLVAYWEVPAHETNAINGRWVEAPVWDLLDRVTAEFPNAPIVAEDLGVITPDVVEVIEHFGFPGMKILLFAFGHDLPSNPYAPHNLERNCLVYTGTHDNNTARGWFENEASCEEKENLRNYLGKDVASETVGMDLIRLSMMSVADINIFPLQDLLGLPEEARMNRPATVEGNWEWRVEKEMLSPSISGELRKMTEIYGRI